MSRGEVGRWGGRGRSGEAESSGEQFRRGEIGEFSLEQLDDFGRTLEFDLFFDTPVVDATKP